MYKKPTDRIVSFFTIAGILVAVLSTVGINYITYGVNTDTYQTNSNANPKNESNNSPNNNNSEPNYNITETIEFGNTERIDENAYRVESVVDGDTIKINYNGSLTSVRIIGVDTPETVDPRTTIECFGVEASDYLKQKIGGKTIRIAADTTQADRDKYNRLLRYIYLDGEDIGLSIIANGYGHEYTYDTPYAHQTVYKKAQSEAESNNKGLWAPNACNNDSAVEKSTTSPSAAKPVQNQNDCNIKGNISWSGEKIYHLPGQQYYESTKIDTAYGERWFCTETEAQNAGWRKSKV